eukprot:5694189-Pyramimonas_sp.AAC.2
MDMIRIRRGAQRALRRWFGDLCVDASLSHHLATLSRFAARISRGDFSAISLDPMPTSFLELFQLLRFSAQLHMQGTLSSDDFAVRITHFLARSDAPLRTQIEREHTAFHDTTAQQIQLAVDAK